MRGSRVFVIVHGVLVLVMVGVALLLVATHDKGVPDANIGAVLATLGIGVLGFPWSIPAIFAEGDGLALLIVTAAALANVAIHEALRRRLTRRPNQA